MSVKLSKIQARLLESRAWTEVKSRPLDRTPVAESDFVPLTPGQERLWFLEQLEPDSPAHRYTVALRVKAGLDRNAVESGLRALTERHAVLRTTFPAVLGRPAQVVSPKTHVPLDVVDLRDLSAAEREMQIQQLAHSQARQSFDLTRGPLWRATWLSLDGEDNILWLTFHRLIMDEQSEMVLRRELAALSSGFASGRSVLLEYLPLSYADFASKQREWLAGAQAESQLAYWKEQLASLSTLQLPTDHPRPAAQTFNGARYTRLLPASLSQALNDTSRREGVTLFITLLAAFQALLHRYTGQVDIVVGSPVPGRTWDGAKNLIGLFENNLVLRADLSDDPTGLEMLARVSNVVTAAFAHQEVPFEKLIEELVPERDMSRTPLFQVLFCLRTAREATAGWETFEVERNTARYDLTLDLEESSEGLRCTAEYNTDLWNVDTLARLLGHYQMLLEGLVAQPARKVSRLPLLTEGERYQLLVEWNRTDYDFPKDQCFAQLFERQVEQTPQHVAAVFNDASLTYEELNRRANGWAKFLVDQEVGPDTLVVILAERSLDFLTAIIAVFKAGGAYLPLDPAHPPSRLKQIIEQSQPRVMIVANEFKPIVAQALESLAHKPEVLSLTDLAGLESRAENLVLRNAPGDLAYVIFTSGSTGAPKGAMVEQIGMVNHLYAKISDLKIDVREVVAQNASQTFDISVWQFLSALLVGGTTCILDDETAYDPARLLDQVQRRHVTVLEIVPSVLRFIVEELERRGRAGPRLNSLRWLIPTGEALPPELCRRWLELYPRIHVVNAYGPTECSDDVTHCFISEPPGPEVIHMPVGRPIKNMQMYILDANLQVVPIGVAGELHVGGIGVGRGYLKRPDLTAERFIPNPFARSDDQPGMTGASTARLYKTGDLARYLADGNIEYLGRIDFQVKVRGFRIELAEIEAALAQHSAIRECVVSARQDQPGEMRLVAYYVAKQLPAPATAELRHFLEDRLPDYMVPSAFVALAAMPLTSNGKINRRALPVPAHTRPELEKSFVASRDALELQLTQLWEELLGVRPIGVQDNFFELGGHSLLAVRLFTEIQQQLGRRLALATLFEAPTVEQLANLLRQKEQAAPRASLVPIQPLGARPPFFMVHPIGGDVLTYAGLARLLGDDQPFYGLRARGLDGVHPPDETIEEMAAHYIEEILTVEPEGPFYIGGYSFGSAVAFEIAQQLHARGKPVGCLVVIDDRPPNIPDRIPLSPAYIYRFLRNIPYWLSDYVLQRTPRQHLGRIAKRFQRRFNRLRNAWAPANVRVVESAFEHDYIVDEIPESYRQVWESDYYALARYLPQPYAGRITLLRVRTQPLFSSHELFLGWDKLAQEGVQVRMISGLHTNVLVEPHVRVLAEQLRAALEDARVSQTEGEGACMPVRQDRATPAQS